MYAAIYAAITSAVLKWINVGIQVSLMWSCWLSAFNPAVGPSVVSEAGEPASPKAAEADNKHTVAGIEKPNFVQIGTNNTAKIGIVPKEEPMPIVIIKPIKSITLTAMNFECSI